MPTSMQPVQLGKYFHWTINEGYPWPHDTVIITATIIYCGRGIISKTAYIHNGLSPAHHTYNWIIDRLKEIVLEDFESNILNLPVNEKVLDRWYINK